MDPIAGANSLATALTAVVLGFITLVVLYHLLKTVVKNPGIASITAAVVVGGLVYYAGHGGLADMGEVINSLVDTYLRAPK
ncbi:hypothetical protein [Luteococcus sp.]|uniref:hypothetical protein n=1 Tax=Luteococcus sp. TaxID=1969402 RepID=UPI003735FCA1